MTGDPQLLRCPSCKEPMRHVEEARSPSPIEGILLDFYRCVGPDCGRKVALWWELTGQGMKPGQQSWVEREVARKGAFFPSDYR